MKVKEGFGPRAEDFITLKLQPRVVKASMKCFRCVFTHVFNIRTCSIEVKLWCCNSISVYYVQYDYSILFKRMTGVYPQRPFSPL